MDNVQYFLGKVNFIFFFANSRFLQGSVGKDVLYLQVVYWLNIENDIVKILKIKFGNQYSKYMNYWKILELIFDVDFFLFLRYRFINRDDNFEFCLW